MAQHGQCKKARHGQSMTTLYAATMTKRHQAFSSAKKTRAGQARKARHKSKQALAAKPDVSASLSKQIKQIKDNAEMERKIVVANKWIDDNLTSDMARQLSAKARAALAKEIAEEADELAG